MKRPVFRIRHRNSRYAHPYAVERLRSFFGLRWWTTAACFTYDDDARRYIKTYNQIIYDESVGK